MSALKPDVDGTHDLGTTALRWRALHVDSITTATAAQGGTDCTVGTNLVVTGNLTVNGDTTTLSTTNLVVEDKTITLANGAADSAAADGAGISIDGASATFLYDDTGTQWELNKPLEVQGNVLPQADSTHDLGSTTLGWNDLHLGSGGVINFSNGDVTATHSANLLTITGGNTRVDRLEIDSAADYIDVDTDLQLIAGADILLDPAGGDVKIDGNLLPNADDGGTLGSSSLNWSDLFIADEGVINLGDDQDIKITHVADTGLLLTTTAVDGDVELQFRDAGLKIHSSANGQLDIDSDGEVEISAVTNVDIDAAALQIDTTGAFSIDGAAASNISVATDGDAEDLTIAVTGATNSSLVLASSGTAADALTISTSAGGMDITVAGAAAGEDLDLTSNTSINITGAEDADDAVKISGSGGGVTIDAGGDSPLELNASGAAINIGNDDVNQNINIGGDGDRTINIGVDDHANTIDLSAQTLTLDAGTSGFTMDGAAASSVTTSDGALTVSGKTGLNLQEDGTSVIAIDTNRDVLFSQTGGSTGDPDVEFDGYVRFDGASEFDGAVQVDGSLNANGAVTIKNTLTVGQDDTGHDVKLFGATSGQFLMWDESEDELVLAGDSKLSFHDAAGGENIIASADGHLEVNAGTTLDMTAPTVDINASTEVTIDTDTLTVSSANAADPLVVIKNTTNDADGARLKFVKDKGAAGAQGDDAGVIQFFADNAAQEQTEFARITAEVQTATDSQEGGKLSLSVAEHDGTMTPGLVLTEGSTDGVIDVAIGAGAGSTTTIAGNLTVNGTTTTVNSTTLQVDDKNIELGVGSADDAAADGGGITLKSGDGDKTFNWVDATDSWTSSEDLDLANGKHFSIAGTTILDANGAAKVQSGVAGAGLGHSDGVLTLDIDELAALGGTGVDQADHFVFSDGGTEKKITFSNLEDAIFGNVSGDATVAAGGALTIAAEAVEGSMLNNNVISGRGEHTGAIDDTDEFLISDAGTVKRTDFSVLRDAVFADVSGDATVAAGGALTIAAGAVENSMLVNDHVTVAGDSGSQDIHLNDTLTIAGTANEIDTSVSGDTITIGLPNDVTIGNNLTVTGTTALNGNVTLNNVNLFVEDASDNVKFQVDNSGNVTVGGTLEVTNSITSNGTELTIVDTLIKIGSNADADSNNRDIGVYAPLSGNNENLGLIWDENEGYFKLYESLNAPSGERFDFSTGTASKLELGELEATQLTVTKTASTSDQATSSGNFTSNVASISHTLTFDGALNNNDSESITVTSNKVLATSVVMGSSNKNADIRIHTVAAGSFICEITNKSGSAFDNDSTIVLNFVVL